MLVRKWEQQALWARSFNTSEDIDLTIRAVIVRCFFVQLDMEDSPVKAVAWPYYY
jgi:hypothetical protein